ncbi:MAG TPA: nuclear transport factor 2 family protein [Polyangiaceae bacterium]|nr:nuclear transport factor 2 family protein [Polyangiaceae bacterium]
MVIAFGRGVSKIGSRAAAFAAALTLLGCASDAGADGDATVTTAMQSEQVRGHDNESVSADLQQQISQVLWGCYAVGADLVGAGDVQNAKNVLRHCFADDMDSQTVTPPAYASLAFNTSGGADNWVDVSNALYRGLGLTRVQHLITNIVVYPKGPNAATVTSGALAVHVYADEHTFNATVKFSDDFRRIDGTWKIKHRVMTVISLTESPAWAP